MQFDPAETQEMEVATAADGDTCPLPPLPVPSSEAPPRTPSGPWSVQAVGGGADVARPSTPRSPPPSPWLGEFALSVEVPKGLMGHRKYAWPFCVARKMASEAQPEIGPNEKSTNR